MAFKDPMYKVLKRWYNIITIKYILGDNVMDNDMDKKIVEITSKIKLDATTFCHNNQCMNHIECKANQASIYVLNTANGLQMEIVRFKYAAPGHDMFFCQVCKNVLDMVRKVDTQRPS